MTDALLPGIPEIATARLRLRGWRAEDRAPFAALNGDAETMRYLGGPMTRAESDAYLDRTLLQWAEDGCGKWVVELAETGAFLGAIGLQRTRFEAAFTPATELAWRMSRDYWGRGYATEAAQAAAAHGFGAMGLARLVAFTVPENRASRALMERLGMMLAGEFDHPLLPVESPLRRHVLYRLERPSTQITG